MLPKSVEYAETPIYEYQQTNPPYVPNINVLPEAQPLIVLASAMVANDASLNAHSSNLRMFCYNILSDAGWSNTAFADLVRSSCDYAVLKFRQGFANSPASALAEAVSEMGMLYASTLVQGFPEITQYITRETTIAAGENTQIYVDLMRDLDSMYSAPVHQAQGPGRYPQPQMNQGRQFSRMASPPPPPRSVQVTRNQARQMPVGHGVPASRHQVQPVKQQTARQPSPNSRPPTAVQAPVEDKVEKDIIQEGIDAMDRKVHTAIYRGEEFPLPLSPIRRGLEEHIELLEEQARNEDVAESPLISPVWNTEASIEDLINTSRADYATKAGAGTYICYGFVVTPIIACNNALIQDCFTRIARAGSFAGIAKELNDILDASKKSTSKEDIRQALALVSQIDRKLTTLTNDFLGNMIESNGIRITCFIEDAAELTRFINETFKGAYNTAYNNYQKQILSHLFQHSRVAGDPTDPVASFYEFSQEGVFWDNMVTAYSITYVSASSIELGYDVTNTPKKVMSVKTPLLERLLKAADGVGSKTGMQSHHLIVTSDNARYMVFKTKAISGEDYFKIKEID